MANERYFERIEAYLSAKEQVKRTEAANLLRLAADQVINGNSDLDNILEGAQGKVRSAEGIQGLIGKVGQFATELDKELQQLSVEEPPVDILFDRDELSLNYQGELILNLGPFRIWSPYIEAAGVSADEKQARIAEMIVLYENMGNAEAVNLTDEAKELPIDTLRLKYPEYDPNNLSHVVLNRAVTILERNFPIRKVGKLFERTGWRISSFYQIGNVSLFLLFNRLVQLGYRANPKNTSDF